MSSLIACYFLSSYRASQRWIITGLFFTTTYLLLSVGIKLYVNTQFDVLFQKHAINWIRYTSRPSPFNLILWSATAETPEGYYYAMVSLLDQKLSDQVFFIPKNQLIPSKFKGPKTDTLISYTKGYYIIESSEDTILIHNPFDHNNNLVGHNTDIDGFELSIKKS